jgi:hypothetical protein
VHFSAMSNSCRGHRVGCSASLRTRWYELTPPPSPLILLKRQARRRHLFLSLIQSSDKAGLSHWLVRLASLSHVITIRTDLDKPDGATLALELRSSALPHGTAVAHHSEKAPGSTTSFPRGARVFPSHERCGLS